jgi:hypothetical protein
VDCPPSDSARFEERWLPIREPRVMAATHFQSFIAHRINERNRVHEITLRR